MMTFFVTFACKCRFLVIIIIIIIIITNVLLSFILLATFGQILRMFSRETTNRMSMKFHMFAHGYSVDCSAKYCWPHG